MSGPTRVLSIDGGGIRGIIPAIVLAEVEERTQKPISELFDLITGTSTGGVLALGLAMPDADGRPRYSARELIDLYEKEGSRIFSRSLWHKVYALGNIVEEKYPAENLEEVLDEYFGEARLGEALTGVLIPCYDIERRQPFFFKSHRAKREPDYDFPMKQAARATSAAPTYFEPVKIEKEGSSDYYALIDGGVFANNPAMCGYAEARVHDRAENGGYLVASLGTGELTRKLPYEEVKGWGTAMWAQPILDVVFDGASDTVDYQMRELLRSESSTRSYYRFQRRLEEGKDDLDDASPTNLRALMLLAQDLIRENEGALEELCARLVE